MSVIYALSNVYRIGIVLEYSLATITNKKNRRTPYGNNRKEYARKSMCILHFISVSIR